jgi:hypothetical protein
MKTKKRTIKVTVIVAVLLALIIAIFAMAGTTFAKYVSKSSTTNQATVAKWGYVVTVDGSNLFSDKYNDVNSDAKLASYSSGDSTAVVLKASSATDTKQRVAPGTTGNMTITISGRAEVLSNISVSVTTDDLKDIYLKSEVVKAVEASDGQGAVEAQDGFEYYPIVWTVVEEVKTSSDATATTTTKTFTTLKELAGYLTGTADTKSSFFGDKAADEYVDYVCTISWAWAFEGQTVEVSSYKGDELTKANVDADKYDTVLGNLVDSKGTNSNGGALESDSTETDISSKYVSCTEVDFNLTVTVKQVQAKS